MLDVIQWTLIALTAAAGIAWFVYVLVVEARRRKLHQQIKEGEVPLDYSKKIKQVATAQNDAILGTGTENETRYRDLTNLRMKVAYIRADGYDRAAEDAFNNIAFDIGIGNNPHPNGSGEAKQWARGYCQLTGTQPKEWMQRA